MHLHASVVALAATSLLAAQDLGGGAFASQGRVPRFVLDRWIPGSPATMQFVDAPSGAFVGAAIVSAGTTSLTLPFLMGTLIADPSTGVVLPIAGPLGLTLPGQLHGRSLFLQGLLFDGANLVLTDATQVNLLRPLAVVGCQRQTANSLLIIDVATWTQVDRIG